MYEKGQNGLARSGTPQIDACDSVDTHAVERVCWHVTVAVFLGSGGLALGRLLKLCGLVGIPQLASNASWSCTRAHFCVPKSHRCYHYGSELLSEKIGTK